MINSKYIRGFLDMRYKNIKESPFSENKIETSYINILQDDANFEAIINNKNLLIGIRHNYVDVYTNILHYYSNSETKNQEHYFSNGKFHRDLQFKPSNTNKLEKMTQGNIITINNANKNAKWFCYDMEYADANGRADILAIDKEKNIKVIELKYNTSSYGGDAGIIKHYKDFYKLKVYPDILKMSAINILRIYKKLGILSKDWNSPSTVNEIKSIEFYFLTVGLDKISPAMQSMCSYLGCQTKSFNLKPNSDKNTETVWKCITNEKDKINYIKAHYCFTKKIKVVDNKVTGVTSDLGALFDNKFNPSEQKALENIDKQETVTFDEDFFFPEPEK